MGKPITQWEVEDSGTLGVGAEYTPVEYPRSDVNRGQVSNSNKGAASRTDIVLDSVALNDTGNVNVPRRDASVKYDAGPYPVIDDADEGVDENDGGTA
jgi:hypothetical protein